ncbi:MAG: PmoA family protein [Phaeodactylibacter sp.]|nr:PmoA family protein [Phaeodactylibacter sp.]
MDHVSVILDESHPKVDVFIDGSYFTSYLFADSILRKPVLFPIYTAGETRLTRGFPFAPNPGERMDHPHHYGLWFNHGDVNGVDFWNSAVVAKNPEARYGSIQHVSFTNMESGAEGILEVAKEWRSDTDALMLTEQTKYIFSGTENRRLITHFTTLTAVGQAVEFRDSKEGMFALRVRRELEVPSSEPAYLFDENLQPTQTKIVDSTNVSGFYQNSNGVQGYPAVWGQRAKWMQLTGKVGQDSIAICIFDHPENLNHPPHWMARDYGLYGVNSFGSAVYTEGVEVFNYVLAAGQSASFKHQVVLVEGALPKAEEIEEFYTGFVRKE